MPAFEPLSFDRALRDAARELDRRKASGEPLRDALPASLWDEETLPWLRELRDKDPIALSLEHWLLRVREQAEFGALRAELGQAHQVQLHPIAEPENTMLPLSAMFARALERPRERPAYLRGLFASAGPLAERIVRLWEARQIFAESAGTTLDSFEVASSELLPAARAFISDTQGAFETLHIQDPAKLLTCALAETAKEGWPARLSPRTISELLGDNAWFQGLRVRSFSLPEARGATSFLRALAELGRALSDAASALRSPFVLGKDVFDLRRHYMGALLGMLPLSATFATRRLGLGPGHVRDQQRLLARAALVDARIAAFRVQLRVLLLSGQAGLRRNLPELSEVALGFELPVHVAGVFLRARARDSQRFAGALLSSFRTERLVETHDEDWFRNPRAIEELRAELVEPAPSDVSRDALESGARALRSRLEALL